MEVVVGNRQILGDPERIYGAERRVRDHRADQSPTWRRSGRVGRWAGQRDVTPAPDLRSRFDSRPATLDALGSGGKLRSRKKR